jgi:hypothetical protein
MPKHIRAGMFLAAAVLCIGNPVPAAAQTPEPVRPAAAISDAPAVLVVKKRDDQYLTAQTLVIACTTGAGSGLLARSLPALGMTALAGNTGVEITAVGCAVGVIGTLAAIGLNSIRQYFVQN